MVPISLNFAATSQPAITTGVRFGAAQAILSPGLTQPDAFQSFRGEGSKPPSAAQRLCDRMIRWYQGNRFIHDKLYKRINLSCAYHDRGYPSCSEYTRQAIAKKGVFKGILLGTLRIHNCNPISQRFERSRDWFAEV